MSGWEETPGQTQNLRGGIIYLIWPGNASGSPKRNWRVLLGRWKSGGPCLARCHHDQAPDKQKKVDGWIGPTDYDG